MILIIYRESSTQNLFKKHPQIMMDRLIFLAMDQSCAVAEINVGHVHGAKEILGIIIFLSWHQMKWPASAYKIVGSIVTFESRLG
jgi:hypothetical protein